MIITDDKGSREQEQGGNSHHLIDPNTYTCTNTQTRAHTVPLFTCAVSEV